MPISVSQTKTVHRAGAMESPGEMPLPQFTASGNTGTVNWSDNGAGGTFSPTSGLTTTYTPLNRTQLVKIRATDSIGNVSVALQIYGTFPLQPFLGYNFTVDQPTQVSYDRDNLPVFREDGGETLSFENVYRRREIADFLVALTFWRHHHKVKPFYYYEPRLGWYKLLRFNSALGNQMEVMDGISFTAQFVGLFDT